MGTDRKPREARLGLVLYGGVSLAVYINGVCREFFDAVRGRGAYGPLKELLQTDIVVDIISGTSAGGINGIFLARALAAGGEFSNCASLWRDHGDILKLLNDPSARTFEDGREEPPSLLQSDTFYEEKLRDAIAGLAGGAGPKDGEVPSRVPEIDVFIPSTDFFGRRFTEKDDRGMEIDVKDHHAVFHLKHREREDASAGPPTVRKSAFVATKEGYDEPTLCAGLARIARATSAFPVAFRPVRNSASGDGANTVMNDALQEMTGVGEETWYVDGGVLDNKPFSHTLREISLRAADREVTRRVFYVEPDPERFKKASRKEEREPSPEQVAMGSLFAIPRYESIAGDLQAIHEHNDRVRRFARLADEIAVNDWRRRHSSGDGPATPPLPGSSVWANDRNYRLFIRGQDPASYCVYVRAIATALREKILPILRTTDVGANEPLLGKLVLASAKDWVAPKNGSGSGLDELDAHLPVDVEYHLRRHSHAIYRLYATLEHPSEEDPPLGWAEAQPVFQFLYRQEEILQAAAVAVERVIEVRAEELVRELRDPRTSELAISNLVARVRLVLAIPSSGAGEAPTTAARSDGRAASDAELDALYEALRRRTEPQFPESLQIDALLRERRKPPVPEVPANSGGSASPDLGGDRLLPSKVSQTTRDWLARRSDGAAVKALAAFDQFPEADAHLFPLQLMSGVRERDEIHLVRLSPRDAKTDGCYAKKFGVSAEDKVSGDTFFHFGGFFKRSWRSNDILWGRFDAAEILIDALLTEDALKKLGPDSPEAAPDAGFRLLDKLGLGEKVPQEVWRNPLGKAADGTPHREILRQALTLAAQRRIALEDVPELAHDCILDEAERREEGPDETRAQERREVVRAGLESASANRNWSAFDLRVKENILGVGKESMGDVALTRVLQAGLGAGILIDRRIGGHLSGTRFPGAFLVKILRGVASKPLWVAHVALRLYQRGKVARAAGAVALLTGFVMLSAIAAYYLVSSTPFPLGGRTWALVLAGIFSCLWVISRPLGLARRILLSAFAASLFLVALSARLEIWSPTGLQLAIAGGVAIVILLLAPSSKSRGLGTGAIVIGPLPPRASKERPPHVLLRSRGEGTETRWVPPPPKALVLDEKSGSWQVNLLAEGRYDLLAWDRMEPWAVAFARSVWVVQDIAATPKISWDPGFVVSAAELKTALPHGGKLEIRSESGLLLPLVRVVNHSCQLLGDATEWGDFDLGPYPGPKVRIAFHPTPAEYPLQPTP